MALRRRTMPAPRRIKALQILPLSREHAAPLGQGTRPRRPLSPAGKSLQACSQPGSGIHRQCNGRDWGMLDPRRPPPGPRIPTIIIARPRTNRQSTRLAGAERWSGALVESGGWVGGSSALKGEDGCRAEFRWGRGDKFADPKTTEEVRGRTGNENPPGFHPGSTLRKPHTDTWGVGTLVSRSK